MRISVHGGVPPAPGHPDDGLDADVEPGLPAGVLRRQLTLLTGDVRWAAGTARLVVDGTVLDDAHPAGVPPLVPGARAGLHAGRGGDPVVAAALADAHVAVVAGPDAGHVRALPVGGRVDVVRADVADAADAGRAARVADSADAGRAAGVAPTARRWAGAGPGAGAGARADAGAEVRALVCPVHDPALDGARVEIRRTRRAVRVRVVGGAAVLARPRPPRPVDGSTADERRARRRRVGRRPRRWGRGDALHVGGSVLRLRTDDDRRRRRRAVPSPWVWSALASTLGGVALAVALRQPLLLLGAAVGVVGLLAGRPHAAAERTAPAPALRAEAGTERAGAPPADVAAVRADAVRRIRAHAGGALAPGPPWPAHGTVALVGAREEALAAARGVVLRALASAPGAPLVVRSDASRDWAWARWLAPRTDLPAGGTTAGAAVVVVDGADAGLAGWRAAAPPSQLLVLVVAPGRQPPAWARTVVRVGAGHAVRTDADGARTVLPAELVHAGVAEDTARRLAADRWTATGGVRGATDPPDDGPGRPAVHRPTPAVLGALPGVPPADAAAVARRWDADRPPRPLRVPLGTADDGSGVVLDLDADGPHVLVGGTTGAGKSELLTTLVLGLALQHPPHHLALLLADFKGGTGLGPLAGLPHVVDHVDDLDAGAARRTLTGLRAELRRRERVLASAGAPDLRRLDPDSPGTPPRLVVVVDELRALVDDVPEAVDVLTRIAAQGRALGVHLVLATQRPAGVVTADLRANVTQRVALRVVDDADSRDVVDVPDAARLDPAQPGRAVVRVGSRAPRTVQVARARHRPDALAVRLVADAVPSARWRPRAAGRDDDVAAWVAAVRRAADGRPGPAVPWCPALPAAVTTDDVPSGEGLALGLADVPDEQRRAPVRWSPGAGPLLVLGGPGSGRSTTLLTVAAQAARHGTHVHTLGLPGSAVRGVVDASALGTVLPLDDVHRACLLLHRLRTRPSAEPPVLLLVDRLDLALEHLGRHARGTGADLLAAAWRDPVPGTALAASAAVVPAITRLLGDFPTRLVLPVVDASADALAGVPTGLATVRTAPGRAVVCGAGPARVCQVALPPLLGAAGTPPAAARLAVAPPLRVVALPTHVRAPERAGASPALVDRRPAPGGTTAVHGATGSGRGALVAPGGVTAVPPPGGAGAIPLLPLGVGGDDGGTVHVDPGRPLVVAGAPGTGRTTALRVLARGWAAAGHRVLRVAPGARSRFVGADPPGAPWTTVDGVGPASGAGDADAAPVVVVVDDADELDRTSPGTGDAVDALLRAGHPRVVAVATTSAHAAAAFRGPVATALRSRHVLVLDPHDADAAALLGPDVLLHADPARRVPGRGVLRRDRTLRRVQVHIDEPGPAAGDP